MAVRYLDETRSLEKLCLDPNNPRFADLGQTNAIPDERVHVDSVQAKAYERIMTEGFDVEQLKESIRNVGYLTNDRVVAVEVPGDRWKVVEGNRRIAALQSLKADVDSGEADPLSDELEAVLKDVPVQIVSADSQEELDRQVQIIQGTRHVPGVKGWGAYQQSQLLGRMLAEGQSTADVREMLGLTAPRLTTLRRVYKGMEQMKGDASYGGFVNPRLFSHFEEALARPRVRTWLDWDDQHGITNAEHKELFYGWIASVDLAGNAVPQKIVDAKDFRLLPKLLDDPLQYSRFLSDPTLNLRDAADRIPTTAATIDWRTVLASDLATLQQVPAISLVDASEEDLELLEDVEQVCKRLIEAVTTIQTQSQPEPEATEA